MDDSETYMNVKFTKTRSSSRDHQTSTNTKLNIRKVEPLINIQTGPHKQEPNENFGNRPDRRICILCLVTSILFTIVVGLSIHVSQIRQSLKRMHSDLHHQFTEMETKYRSINETKAQICEFLISRREQACSQDWIRNADLCYFISTFTIPYGEAKELCSHLHSKLLEINSTEEEKFVSKAVEDQDSAFWVGKCKVGEAASNVVYKVNAGKFECSECKSGLLGSCKNDQHRFICEKPAPLCPDIPEKIRDRCQKPVSPT
ncbi:C-type lectin domain family 4 member A-like [Hemitrygon akajei]|uniref:C-type lectin domain family 4 member A-like n=1 Tax=Hemitrygon akajei TaxID=2704970 RepID=UPI003BF9F0D0